MKLLKPEFDIHAQVFKARDKYVASIELIPYRNAQQLEILKAFDLTVEFIPTGLPTNPLPNYANESVLSNGSWFKISIKQRGVYKLTRVF